MIKPITRCSAGIREVAGMVGFEPTVHCTKNSCLTTWLHPNVETLFKVLWSYDQVQKRPVPKLPKTNPIVHVRWEIRLPDTSIRNTARKPAALLSPIKTSFVSGPIHQRPWFYHCKQTTGLSLTLRCAGLMFVFCDTAAGFEWTMSLGQQAWHRETHKAVFRSWDDEARVQ